MQLCAIPNQPWYTTLPSISKTDPIQIAARIVNAGAHPGIVVIGEENRIMGFLPAYNLVNELGMSHPNSKLAVWGQVILRFSMHASTLASTAYRMMLNAHEQFVVVRQQNGSDFVLTREDIARAVIQELQLSVNQKQQLQAAA